MLEQQYSRITEPKSISVYLRATGEKVGVIAKDGNMYEFTYDKAYKGPIPFVYDRDENGCAIILSNLCVKTTFDHKRPYRQDHFFKELSSNFPEGYTLQEFINFFGYDPYSRPLCFMLQKGHDGTFIYKANE